MKTIPLIIASTTIFLHIVSCNHLSLKKQTIIGRAPIAQLVTQECTVLSLPNQKIVKSIAILASLPGRTDKKTIPIEKKTCTSCNKSWYLIKDPDFKGSYEIFTTQTIANKEERQNKTNNPKNISDIDKEIFIQMIVN